MKKKIPEKETVSRETKDIYREYYNHFKANGLKSFDSAYNALYFTAQEKMQSGKKLKKQYKDVFAHPKGWFESEGDYAKSRLWSGILNLLLFLPKISNRMASFRSGAKNRSFFLFEWLDDAGRIDKSAGRWLWRNSISAAAVIFAAAVALNISHKAESVAALELYVDGERVGYVKSAQVYFAALDSAEDNLSNLLGLSYKIPDGTSSYKVSAVNAPEYLSDTEITTALIKSSEKYLATGYGLYIDETLVAVGGSRMIMDNLMSETLDAYKKLYLGSSKADSVVSFSNSIKIKEITVPKSVVKSEKEIRELLGLDEFGVLSSVLLTDRTPASKLELPRLDGISPEKMSQELPENSVLYIDSASNSAVLSDGKPDTRLPSDKNDDKDIPVLAIKTCRTQTFTEIVPCEVEYIYDAQMMEGRKIVSSYGADGVKSATYDVYYDEDDREVERKLVSERTLRNSVPKVVKIGTRPISEFNGDAKITGTYILPYEGQITSYFAGRTLFGQYEFHGALDIFGPYGANILSSDGGEVVFAGTRGTYGKCVIIDHGNGIETLYAHMSSLAVETGDFVGQGWKIGEMGKTGRTTGVHVHFEVREDGIKKDPLKYVNQ